MKRQITNADLPLIFFLVFCMSTIAAGVFYVILFVALP